MFAITFDRTVADTEQHHPKGVSGAYADIAAALRWSKTVRPFCDSTTSPDAPPKTRTPPPCTACSPKAGGPRPSASIRGANLLYGSAAI